MHEHATTASSMYAPRLHVPVCVCLPVKHHLHSRALPTMFSSSPFCRCCFCAGEGPHLPDRPCQGAGRLPCIHPAGCGLRLHANGSTACRAVPSLSEVGRAGGIAVTVLSLWRALSGTLIFFSSTAASVISGCCMLCSSALSLCCFHETQSLQAQNMACQKHAGCVIPWVLS